MVALKPIITEKSFSLSQKGVYVFRVRKDMTKPDIAKLLQNQYGVAVSNVRTLVMPSRTKRAGKTRQVIRQESWKKAFVTLAKGQTLELFASKES